MPGFETDLQKVQFADKYARWNPAKGRRETWEETVSRVMNFLLQQATKRGKSLSDKEWQALADAMGNLEVLPSMRIVQMAGPALERCNVGAYNCAYLPLKDWQSFSELLYILMQGTGVGFSVEQQYVSQLPVIVPQGQYVLPSNVRVHTTYVPGTELSPRPALGPSLWLIQDSTEGWCDAFFKGLEYWSTGRDITFDYSAIRPYGAPLLTKGGKASGPGPLRDLLDFTRKLLLSHQGRQLSSLNAHDLACYCGSIVQVGGVRRAAEISLSNLDDAKMARAKSGNFWQLYPERMMANNSVVYDEKPSMEEFRHEWQNLVDSGTGERGIFNRGSLVDQMPIRRDPWHEFGVNPCGEIILRPYEFCNLSIAVARPYDTRQDLARKVQLATQFGMFQSLLTDFKYIRPEWKQNCEQERLLGVDINGQMDNAWLSSPEHRDHTYMGLQAVAVAEAQRMSMRWELPMPAAVTCVKPSGNSSQLLNVSSGIHPRYAPYYIRRLRIGAGSPVARLLIDAGVPHHAETAQDPDNPTIWVFEFPVKSPEGAICRNDRDALAQLEQWKSCKIHYTEHNPSVTVYIKENEWTEVGQWVWDNWDIVGGLSFLPHTDHLYLLAPYEEITEDEYLRRTGVWPDIDFSRLAGFESTDSTELNREFACTGDKCEI